MTVSLIGMLEMAAEPALVGLLEAGFYPKDSGNRIISDDIIWGFLTDGSTP